MQFDLSELEKEVVNQINQGKSYDNEIKKINPSALNSPKKTNPRQDKRKKNRDLPQAGMTIPERDTVVETPVSVEPAQKDL